MNADLAIPPRWAQRVLGLTLAERDQNTVAGDLLEEYRATVVPERGNRQADLWYSKQVASFLWIAAVPGIVLLAVAVLLSFLRTALPHIGSARQLVMALMVTTESSYFLAGLYGGWLTCRVRTGMVMVVTAVFVAVFVNVAATLVTLTLPALPPTSSQLNISRGHLALLVFPGFALDLLVALVGGAAGRAMGSRRYLTLRRSSSLL